MDLGALVRKEALTIRRNIGVFVLLLVIFPGALVAGTMVFEQTIPRDVPVGVVPLEDDADDEVSITNAAVTSFATPEPYESVEDAEQALQREEVYIVILVPPDVMDADTEATYTLMSDRAFVPIEEPVNESGELLESQVDQGLAADVTVEHDRIGDERTLAAYLVPSGLLTFVVLYSMVYLPYQVRSERLVLDRLQTESRLETVLASKFLVYGGLLFVPLLTAGVVTAHFGHAVDALSPLALLSLALTFVYLTAIGLAVLFAGGLRRVGLACNLALSLGILALSSVIFPVGFFSSLQKTIARALPTHYSMITTRSGMLRETPISLYTDYLLLLAGTALLSLLVLQCTLIIYRRRR